MRVRRTAPGRDELVLTFGEGEDQVVLRYDGGLNGVDAVEFGDGTRLTRDQLFEIPKGTWERRMKGDKASILPEQITLTLGVRDVLLLRNSDTVPQMFGPVLIMPGQDFRLPFETVSENQFECSAHASGQMTVIVEPMPNPGTARVLWRLRELSKSMQRQ